MKFIKGIYAFTVEELNKLIELHQRGEFVEINGKQYIPLRVEKKSADFNREEFERLVFIKQTKKEIYEEMGTTFYKYRKFCEQTYGTDELAKIREIIRPSGNL